MPGTAKEWDELMRERLDVAKYAESLKDRRVPRFPDGVPKYEDAPEKAEGALFVEFPARAAKKNDEVNRPEHYNSGSIECIEAIKASMSPEEFKGYLKGNSLKYLWRYSYKGKPKQDLEKAKWYLGRLIESVQ
jgi:hypothetical protein